jgi:hypothetical protein
LRLAAAGALELRGALIRTLQHIRTRAKLRAEGPRGRPVSHAELAKAGADVTCRSLQLRLDGE